MQARVPGRTGACATCRAERGLYPSLWAPAKAVMSLTPWWKPTERMIWL